MFSFFSVNSACESKPIGLNDKNLHKHLKVKQPCEIMKTHIKPQRCLLFVGKEDLDGRAQV